jgi:hypothetical protein
LHLPFSPQELGPERQVVLVQILELERQVVLVQRILEVQVLQVVLVQRILEVQVLQVA